ncbi:TetR family transcriptional regulator [Nocardioides sp.]|uniref:TetR/AcrR family transcriptional regulator n=1 Tax=Nocardioides sp. TaxID=35761 RepID=UPI0039E4E5FA
MVGTLAVRDTRNRVLDAAVRLTIEVGWAQVTMTALARTAGVSRQTLYNEVGVKSELAQAMVLREMERFLDVVSGAFDRHPRSLITAIRAACKGVLERARDNPLLVAVATATHGGDTELLPFLTTHSDWLLEGSRVTIRARVADYQPPLDDRELDTAIDIVVRTVLSHVMHPSGTPAQTADGIAWMAGQLLKAATIEVPEPRAEGAR